MKKTFRPVVDVLESRWVPALILQLDAEGNLTGIFGVPDGDVLLEVTADDEVRVEENGNDLGTYSVPGNLTVSLGNVAVNTALDVDMSTGTSLSGSLFMTLGNALGGYDVSITGDGATSSIFGSLKVKTGSGDDTIDVIDMAIGGSASLDANGGGDVITVDGTDVSGNLKTANAGVTVDNGTIEGNFSHTQTEGLGAGVTLGAGSSVLGNASFAMTAGAFDIVTLEGVVDGNVSVSARGGGDTVNFDVDATILGSFIFTGGAGDDAVNFDGTLGGNFSASLAAGADAVTFDGATVLGSSIAVLGGNGADVLDATGGLTAPGARLTFLGGSGADDVSLHAGTLSLASAYLDGGFGTDTCTLTGTFSFPFTKRSFP